MSTEQIAAEAEHEFLLILDGIDEMTPEPADAFFEAGCGDATLGVRCRAGHLEFSRIAASMKDAVLSAIRNVWKVGRGITVRQIDECNLLTQSEIARRINRSRQFVHQCINSTGGKVRFPTPHFIGNKPYWGWCEVSQWLFEYNIIRQDTHDHAILTFAINNLLDRIDQRRKNGP